MITLLASAIFASSLIRPPGSPGITPVTNLKFQQSGGLQELQQPLFPNGHPQNWIGFPGHGTLPASKPNEQVRFMPPSGSSISPVATATLIQGWFAAGYTEAQWQQLFQSLASEGITTVVLLAAVDETPSTYQGTILGESGAYPAYYQTARYPVSSTVTSTYPHVSYTAPSGALRSPVEECLYWALHNNVNNSMNVYLGLNFYSAEWGTRTGYSNGASSTYTDPITDSTFCTYEANLGAAIATDLTNQFGSYSSFAGWYFPWEVDNLYFDQNLTNSSLLSGSSTTYEQSAYNNLITMLDKSFVPLASKPRIISPFFNPYLGSPYTASEYKTLWTQIFGTTYSGSSIFKSTDIFAPQDGAGDYLPGTTPGIPSTATVVSNINTWYPPLIQAATSISGMQVWANADTYQTFPAVQNAPFFAGSTVAAFASAGTTRLNDQFTAESTVNYGGTNYLSKIMNCCNVFYQDPLYAWANPVYNTAWNAWYQSGATGSSAVPYCPSATSPTNHSGSLQLTLTESPSAANGVCGYYVWRDNTNTASTPYDCVEIPVTISSSTTFIDQDTASFGANHTYYIEAFDVYGNVSPVTEFTNYAGSFMSLSPSPVLGGNSSTGTVTLSSAAPSGGTTVTLSSNNSHATVPSSVTVASGNTTATFTVTTTSVSSATIAMITGTYPITGGTATMNTSLLLNATGLSGVSVSPTSVVGGTSSTGTVTLTAPAPSGGTSVSLASSSASASVPSSVTVAYGNTSATFTVTTSAVAASVPALITATLSGNTATATLPINPPVLSSLSLSPYTINGGATSTGTVTLGSAAPTGGLSVVLYSNNTKATVPATVTVSAGSTTANFTVTTSTVTSSTTASIYGVMGGSTQYANLTMTPVTITSVTLSPSSVSGGINSTGTVTITSGAPTGGAVIGLTSNNACATVPSTVTIAAGATSANFNITTTGVSSYTTVTITGTIGSSTQSAYLAVTPASLASLSLSPSTVYGGASSTGTVTLNGVGAPGGTSVPLTSSSGSATVPASVTVAAGASTATFTVTTTAVSSQVLATITGTADYVSQHAVLTINPYPLSSVSVSPTSVAGGTSSTGTVTLTSAAPVGGTVVSLSSNLSSATVPSSVTVAYGATTANFTVTTTAVSSTGTATITATLGTTNKTATLTVSEATVSSVTVSPTSVLGSVSSTGTVTLASAAGPSGDVVTLSSNNACATVPATVTVAAGATTANFTITTTSVTTYTTVTIAGAIGSSNQSALLAVTPDTVTGLSISPSTVLGSVSTTGTVTLGTAAGPGGVVVALSSNNGNAHVPTSVTVASGSTTANFTITTLSVTSNTTVTITSAIGTSNQSAFLYLTPDTLVSLSLSPTSVVGGNPSTGTVTISTAAGPGGVVVLLSSNNGSATVPVSVTVASGSTTATFTVTTTAVSSTTSASITGSIGTSNQTAVLTITP